MPGRVAGRRVCMTSAGGALGATIPQGRFGEAADLVGAILFLASDESAYVIG